MERLIYASAATGRTDNLLNMATILAESQRNNVRDGLTGVLAAHRDRYIQVVEGPNHALDDLLRRLSGDPRHRDIVIFGREAIEHRNFADWSMAHARVTPELAGALDDLMREATLSPKRTIALMLQAVADPGIGSR